VPCPPSGKRPLVKHGSPPCKRPRRAARAENDSQDQLMLPLPLPLRHGPAAADSSAPFAPTPSTARSSGATPSSLFSPTRRPLPEEEKVIEACQKDFQSRRAYSPSCFGKHERTLSHLPSTVTASFVPCTQGDGNLIATSAHSLTRLVMGTMSAGGWSCREWVSKSV